MPDGEPMPTLLVRYGEIGLKSASVRSRFEQRLLEDIRRRHTLAEVPCVISWTRGRLFVDSDDWRKSCEILSRTFGVVSFSPVEKVSSDPDKLREAVLDLSDQVLFRGARFAIRTRRSGNHPYTSQTLAASLGEAVLERHRDKGVRVCLDEPDIEISVEVRDRDAYLYTSTFPGPGGMPIGTQGRVLSLIDSELGLGSTWLMMKRGCSVLAMADEEELVEPLQKWYPSLRRIPIEADLFEAAERAGCIGIAVPLTIEDIEKKALKGPLPVFYPLIGMTRPEIEGLLERVRG